MTSLTILLVIMKYLSRPNSDAVKDIDTNIVDILDHNYDLDYDIFVSISATGISTHL